MIGGAATLLPMKGGGYAFNTYESHLVNVSKDDGTAEDGSQVYVGAGVTNSGTHYLFFNGQSDHNGNIDRVFLATKAQNTSMYGWSKILDGGNPKIIKAPKTGTFYASQVWVRECFYDSISSKYIGFFCGENGDVFKLGKATTSDPETWPDLTECYSKGTAPTPIGPIIISITRDGSTNNLHGVVQNHDKTLDYITSDDLGDSWALQQENILSAEVEQWGAFMEKFGSRWYIWLGFGENLVDSPGPHRTFKVYSTANFTSFTDEGEQWEVIAPNEQGIGNSLALFQHTDDTYFFAYTSYKNQIENETANGGEQFTGVRGAQLDQQESNAFTYPAYIKKFYPLHESPFKEVIDNQIGTFNVGSESITDESYLDLGAAQELLFPISGVIPNNKKMVVKALMSLTGTGGIISYDRADLSKKSWYMFLRGSKLEVSIQGTNGKLKVFRSILNIYKPVGISMVDNHTMVGFEFDADADTLKLNIGYDLDVAVTEVVNTGQIDALSNYNNSIALIKKIEQLSPKVNTGPIVGRARAKGKQFGFANKDFLELDALSRNLQASYQKAISGVAVSEQEAKRLEKFLPLTSDSDTVFDTKLETLKGLIAEQKENLLKTINAREVSGGVVDTESESARPAGVWAIYGLGF